MTLVSQEHEPVEHDLLHALPGMGERPAAVLTATDADVLAHFPLAVVEKLPLRRLSTA